MAFFESEGWKTKPTLPQSWMVRKANKRPGNSDRVLEYLSDNFTLLPTFGLALDYLKKNGFSNDEIDRFKENSGMNWRTDPDLPEGWRFAESRCIRKDKSVPITTKTYMDSDGQKYSGISHVCKFFLKRDGDFEIMKNFLYKEGWFETNLVPEGFLMRQKMSEKGFYFLTLQSHPREL